MKSKLESIFVILIMLLSIANIKFCADAIANLNDNTEKRYISQSDIKSNQYLVTDEYIARISPKTMVESFVMQIGLADKEIAIYEDENKEVEVQEGLISTGMIMTVSEKQQEIEEVEQENTQETVKVQEEQTQEEKEEIEEKTEERIEEKTEEDYKLSVVGDINSDGNANIVEVVQIINHLAGFEGKEIEGIKLISSDINGDTEVNLIDIDKLIRYIVFEELEIGEVGAPKEPIIEVEGEEKEGWHKGDVKVIIKTQEEEFLKTVYVIDEEVKETVNKIEEETIRQNGVHKIQVYTYGKNESKSIIAEKEVKIDKEAPEIKSINKSTEEETQVAVIIEIIAQDNLSGLAEEAYSFDGGATWQKENYKEYTTNQEEIKIQVKDKVGNIREETINIQNIVQEKTKYKVEFKNEDGTVLQSEELEEGILPQYKGEEPTKAEDNTYTYKFAGWDKEVTAVNGNQEYVARYTETYKNYTIVFKNEDGSIISSKEDYHYGDTVVIPQEPTKAEDETYTYKFAGWDKEVTAVNGNQEYVARYTETYKNYTIIFKNEDGSIISSKEDYHYGDTVVVPQEPTKAEDNTYTYKFAGWDKEVTAVNGNQEYIATYTKELINYTIEYELNGGTVETENPTTYNVETENFTLNNPTKKWYKFIGWTLNEETELIENITIEKGSTGNRKYTANWELEGENVKVKETDKLYASIEMALQELGNGETIILLNNTSENIVIGENKTIKIDLNGKTITNANENEATIINKGTLTIVDDSGEQTGQVENTNNIAIINDGNLTIGYNDGIIEEHVIVKGETNAIQNNGNFYMYDGTLIGKITITGNDAIMPEGEEYGLSIKEENGMQIATIEIIEIPVAQVENTYYTSLQQAIDENNGKTVKIIKDELIITEPVTVPKNTEIVLDLNGKKLESTGSGYVIENSGVLKITDSTQAKTGKIINNNGNGLKNTGELTVENISISTQIDAYYVDVYAIYNDGGVFYSNGIAIEVKAVSNSSKPYGIYNTNKTTANINDSNINLFQEKNFGATGIHNIDSTVTIQKSNINIDSVNVSNAAYGIYNNNTNLNLSDVEIDVESKYYQSSGINNTGNYSIVEIEGGKIRSENRGINNASGTLIINVNTINADSYGVYNSSTAKFEVYGGVIESANSCGIINSEGTFNFFGGTIKGKTEAISGSINEITSGKKIKQYEQDNIKIAELTDVEQIDVAEIGSTKYTTLEKALIVNKENTQEIYIKLIENTEELNIQVEESQNITIDLNGKQLLLYEEIVNKGILKIIDTSEEKSGYVLSKSSKIIENNADGAILEITGITADLKANSISGYGLYNSNGTINVTDSNINVEILSSKQYVYAYGIYNSNGNVNIQKSNISAVMETSKSSTYAYGIYNKKYNKNNITLGEKNNSSSDDLIITAKGGTERNIGIYNYDGTFNFYDGIIKAEDSAISGTITEIETGYELYEYIDEENSLNAVKLIEKIPVAKIGDVEYFSIQEAVNSSIDNEETTIEVLRDIKLTTSEIAIGENKNIILDLNGYTLTATTENTINNLGKLNIIDSSSETTGVIENTSNNRFSKVIYNEGELKLTQGKINKVISEYNSYGYGIYNNGEGKVEILGGIITANSSSDYYGIYNNSINNVVVNGGTIELKGKFGCAPVGIYNNSTGNIIVNDVEIIIESSDTVPCYGITNYSTGNVQINGGSINVLCTTKDYYEDTKMYGINNVSTGIITIKGGNITSNITSSSSCNAYAIYNSSEGTVNIENGEIVGIAGITSGGVYYPQTGYGIYNKTGTLNYYGGTIKGTTESIYGEVTSITEGKKILITQEETIEVATLEEDTQEEIFKVGENTYSELKTAIEACQDENNTIEITKDAVLTNSVNIGEIVIEKDIVLDLKGFSLKLYNQITNKSNLTIIDSSSEKTGILESKAKHTIHNEEGILTISDVTILGGKYGVYNNGGNVKIENASIKAETYGIYNNENIIKPINIELKGANITSSQYGIYTLNEELSIINIKVSDLTTISTTSLDEDVYGIYNYNKDNGKIELTIDGESNISARSGKNAGNSYGICNDIDIRGEIKIELLSGTINSKATSQSADAYGIYTSQYYNNKNYSNVKIAKGLITVDADSEAIGISSADIEMTGGTIQVNSYRNSYGIDNRTNINGNIVITDGVISATSPQGYGVYTKKGKVTIGSMDGEVNKLIPDISGSRTGVYIDSASKFDFYDGIIKGSSPIEGTVTDTEPGYKVNISTVDSVNTATLTKISTAEAIAQVGNLYFNNLQQAINACKTGEETIKLLVHINSTETLKISEEQIVTIDLNGFTITGNIENNGTLNITNNKGTVAEGNYGTITGTGTINVQ